MIIYRRKRMEISFSNYRIDYDLLYVPLNYKD